MNFLKLRAGRANLPRLQKLLSQQKDALMKGRLVDLAAHTAGLESVQNSLAKIDGELADSEEELLRECLRLAEANLALIAAGRDGLKAAQSQLAAISRAQAELNTYSGTGQRQDLLAQSHRLEKRS